MSLYRLSPVLAVLSIASPCLAQEPAAAMPDVSAWVREAAFDPATYFPSQYIRDSSTVRIAYAGDDYGWPVYAIAIARGCLDGETIASDACAGRLRARMVRVPEAPEPERPRARGARLVSRVSAAGVSALEDVKRVLPEMELEWVEADLRTCPGALEALAASSEAVWVPPAVSHPTPDNGLPAIVLHADIVRVEVQQYARLSTYSGWIAEGSPAAWAVALAEVLAPCWMPAQVPAPWTR